MATLEERIAAREKRIEEERIALAKLRKQRAERERREKRELERREREKEQCDALELWRWVKTHDIKLSSGTKMSCLDYLKRVMADTTDKQAL